MHLSRVPPPYLNRAVRTIGKELPGGRLKSCCENDPEEKGASPTRRDQPDVVFTDGRGNGSLYEIKLDNPPGRVAGLSDVAFYLTLLNTHCGLSISRGACIESGLSGGPEFDDDCGTLSWYCDPTSALILYNWSTKKQDPVPPIMPVITGTIAAAEAETATIGSRLGSGAGALAQGLTKGATAVFLFFCVTCWIQSNSSGVPFANPNQQIM
jgi:hypothetical protein